MGTLLRVTRRRTVLALLALITMIPLGAMLAVGRGAPDWAPEPLLNLGHDTRLLLRPALIAANSLLAGPITQRRIYLAEPGDPLLLRRGTLNVATTRYRPRSGPPRQIAILLVHGSTPFARRLGLYRALAEHLRDAGFHVMAMDQFGYGGSSDPQDPTNPDEYQAAQAVCMAAEQVRQLSGMQRVAVVGHSLGADASLAAAHEYQCMSTLVAIGPARRFDERAGHPQAPEVRYQARREMRHMGLAKLPTDTFLATRGQLALERHLGWLAEPTHLPVLFIDGGLESAEDLAFLRAAYARMQGPVQYLTLPQADHYANTIGLGSIIIEDKAAMQHLSTAIVSWVERSAP